MTQWEQKFQDVIQSKMSDIKDPSHDYNHIMRVVRLTKYISEKEQAKTEVTVPAAYFHDIIDIKKNSALRSKASKMSSLSVLNILSQLKYPHQYWDQIAHAIEAHSYSAQILPKTLEAKVLQDADRLDALGAIGIARCFSVGQYMNAAFYNSIDPFAEHRNFDDKKFSLDHFYTKLLKLPNLMYTQTAVQLAKKRQKFMLEYLQNLEDEVFNFNPSKTFINSEY